MKIAGAFRFWLLVLIAVTAAVDFAVVFLDLYGWYPRLDIPTHILNTFTVTLLGGLLVWDGLLYKKLRYVIPLVLLALAGLGFGALFEVAEWALERLEHPAVTWGRTDTVADLVADVMGSFGAALVLALRDHKRSVRHRRHGVARSAGSHSGRHLPQGERLQVG